MTDTEMADAIQGLTARTAMLETLIANTLAFYAYQFTDARSVVNAILAGTRSDLERPALDAAAAETQRQSIAALARIHVSLQELLISMAEPRGRG